MTKIVIMDYFALNPGDINLDAIKKIGEVESYPRTEKELTVARGKGASVILTNKVWLGKAEIDALPDLKYIGVLATGYNVVDIDYATKKNIVVTNIPTYGTASVAQMVFAHILEFTNNVSGHNASVKAGDWTKCIDFCYFVSSMSELAGKTIGIIGFGRIGQKIARIAEAFDMKVLAYDKYQIDLSAFNATRYTDMDTLLCESDFVSVNCPLTAENKYLINKEALKKMKKTAILVNTARGPLVCADDLAWALNNDIIKGAGIDVLEVEPPRADNPLLHAKNVHITPHTAWGTVEARQRLADIAADNIKAFLIGKPINTVNTK